MNNAINTINYIVSKVVRFFFDSEFLDGVSIGWVFIVVMIFGVLFNAIINAPKSISSKEYRHLSEEVKSRNG